MADMKGICTLGLVSCLLSSPALAQTTDAAEKGQLSDIIVTAEKRTVSIDKVPLAVTAVTGAALASQGVNDLQGVAALIPNFNYGEAFGAAKLSVRGISYSNLSTGAEGSVAYNLNDVYVARPAGQLGNFYDIERVEVLRGPQGTLYGRNATGGAFNIYSTRPSWSLEAYGQATIGNYDERTFEGAVSGPLIDETLAARLAVFVTDRDGYGTNLVTGHDIDDNRSRAARLSILAKPAPNFTVLIVGDVGKEHDRSRNPHLIAQGGLTGEPGTSGTPIIGVSRGGLITLNSYDTYANTDPDYERRTGGVLIDAKLDLGSVALRSISSWRRTHFSMLGDLDGSSAVIARIYYDEKADQYAQEFNFSYTGNKLDIISGLYYFRESLDGSFQTPRFDPVRGIFFQNFFAGGHLLTNAAAVFGQASYHMTDRLTLVVGARYSTEKKSEADLFTDFANSQLFLEPLDRSNPPVGPAFRQSKRWKAFTPKVGLNFQIEPGTLLYGSYSKGFKAGVFNLGAATAAPGNPSLVSNPPVNPEKISAFELGLKTRQFNNRVRLALTGFYYDYSDLQLTKIEGTLVLLTNAAKARTYGVEFESEVRATDRLTLSANATWLHARFTEFTTLDPARRPLGPLDLSGNQLPQAPNYTATGSADYRVPLANGSITFHGDVFWTSRVYHSEFNRLPVSQAAYAKVNASVGWNNERFGFTVFGKNLLNKKTVDSSYQSSVTLGYPIFGWLAPPRTYGVRLTARFN